MTTNPAAEQLIYHLSILPPATRPCDGPPSQSLYRDSQLSAGGLTERCLVGHSDQAEPLLSDEFPGLGTSWMRFHPHYSVYRHIVPHYSVYPHIVFSPSLT